MMTIDKLETQIEKLLEKARTLHFPFKNSDYEQEADESKNSVIAGLENFLELASRDWSERPEEESSEDDS